MARNEKAPPAGTGEALSFDRLGSGSGFPLTLDRYRTQFVMTACHVRPELAAMVAGAAFGGGNG